MDLSPAIIAALAALTTSEAARRLGLTLAPAAPDWSAGDWRGAETVRLAISERLLHAANPGLRDRSFRRAEQARQDAAASISGEYVAADDAAIVATLNAEREARRLAEEQVILGLLAGA